MPSTQRTYQQLVLLLLILSSSNTLLTLVALFIRLLYRLCRLLRGLWRDCLVHRTLPAASWGCRHHQPNWAGCHSTGGTRLPQGAARVRTVLPIWHTV
jgi:hypothetical protein